MAPATGASTSSVWSSEIIALTVIAIIVIIILILVILFVCCRGCLQSIFPCCVTKVGPEEKTQWHYVNRFGETNLKFVSYKLSDVRRKKLERENLVQSSSEDDVPKNISIQVPVFEEKLNGTVKKKSLHISNGTPTAPQSTSIPTFTVSSGQQPKALPPLPVRLRGTPTNSPITVRRPPSAFNKPRVRPNETDYQDFILGNQHQITDSKISIDDDDDDYR